LNQGNDGGKNSEIQSTVHAPSSNLKGNENNLNLNLQNKLVRNCDDPFVSSGIEHTQTLCADLIDSYVNTSAENLQVDNHCSIMKDHCYALTDIGDTLHANNVDHVKLLTHADFFHKNIFY